jgi:glycosyltransferase involved in cell wall biosynthesis
LKIIHIISSLSTGGAERALFNLLQGGLAEKFECHVVSLGDGGTIGPLIERLGVPVTTLNMGAGQLSLSALLNLRRVVREYQPDIIQGWMYHGNLAAVAARYLVRRRAIVGWNVRHSLYDLSLEKPMTQKVIRTGRFLSASVDSLLYNSNISRLQHEDFGFSRDSGQVIPNGINVEQFSRSSGSRDQQRAFLGIPTEAKVVGHIARFHPMKDHAAFLRAAVDLACQYPETHFLLIGREVSIENKPFQQLIPAQVRNRFHLLGERSDIPELMSAMDIFCLSSAWGEGFPNVIGEAMATGLPCVATDVGDSAIVIGDTGVVVARQIGKALAAGIESLLTMRPDDRHRLGSSARARIKENYELGAIVRQYVALYEEIVRRKRGG